MSSSMESGFTLAEMAVVVFISGLLMAAAASMAIPIMRDARRIETQGKLQNIAKAIDFYAAQNLRVPCPASPDQNEKKEPFGAEMGSGPGGKLVPMDCGTDAKGWEGIVPFKALGIPVEWIKDGGHFITYAISPGFAQDVSKDSISVHARCRTADWFDAGIVYGPNINDPKTNQQAANVVLPKNARRARFCCSGSFVNDDLLILDANAKPQIAVPRQTNAESYKPANVPFPDPAKPGDTIPDNDRATAPVYVLVSHGQWGEGSFSGKGREKPSGWRMTPAEKENANGDRKYAEIPVPMRANAEISYDDTVLWRTQDMILASQLGSCSLP
jgi:prepilin-type N-terminal cleavage/methylation domain-containing protein